MIAATIICALALGLLYQFAGESFCDVDLECCFLLPHLSVQVIKCTNEQCQEIHGWSVALGWLCFTLNFYFPKSPDEPGAS